MPPRPRARDLAVEAADWTRQLQEAAAREPLAAPDAPLARICAALEHCPNPEVARGGGQISLDPRAIGASFPAQRHERWPRLFAESAICLLHSLAYSRLGVRGEPLDDAAPDARWPPPYAVWAVPPLGALGALLSDAAPPSGIKTILARAWSGFQHAAQTRFADAARSPGEFSGGKHAPAAIDLCTAAASDDGVLAELVHFHERLLAELDPRGRKRAGVYYTPYSIARFVTRGVRAALAGLDDGGNGAERPAEPTLLDPAAGTGVFLVAAIWEAHAAFVQSAGPGRAASDADAPPRDAPPRSASAPPPGWPDFALRRLLPRLYGYDASPTAVWLARLHVAWALRATGVTIPTGEPPRVYLQNSLAPPLNARGELTPAAAIVVGNPPYAALNGGATPLLAEWVRDYKTIEGAPLGERKHWLHDDYMLFLRVAQRYVERAGAGVVGFLLNHNLLDNVTFRAARRSLLGAFDEILVCDLHGNVKKREKHPAGGRDENILGLQQGLAVCLLVKHPASPVHGSKNLNITLRADLWGSRSAKLAALREHTPRTLIREPIHPAPPWWSFASPARDDCREYDAWPSLLELFHHKASGVITARDHFAVDVDREALRRRVAAFRDPALGDEQVRARWFLGRTRSARHAAGETRGWRLDEARRQARADDAWETRLAPCLYRPFDTRWVCYADWLVDWPRRRAMRHLAAPGNLGLVTRRQSPAGEANFFFVTRNILMDGAIRSDNRGGEVVFPLRLMEPAEGQAETRPGGAALNLRASAFTEFWRACENTRSTTAPPDDSLSWLWPERVFHYLYAVFHSRVYRQRYEARLRLDYPRAPPPRDAALCAALETLGGRLVTLHTTPEAPEGYLPTHDQRSLSEPCVLYGTGEARVENVRYDIGRQRVWINDARWFAPVPLRTWEHRVGAHQVCRKWLRDRRGAVLGDADIHWYGAVAASLERTRELMDEIDAAIAGHGGWPDAFA